MKGILFDNVTVNLAPRCLGVTATWKNRTPQGVPIAYGPELIKAVYNYLKGIKNPVMLDVGAAVGSFALLGVALPTLWVTAFEPHTAARQFLRVNVQLNGLGKWVKILPYALLDKDGQATLKIPVEPHRMGMATLGTPKRFRGGTSIKVDARRMDSLDMGPVHLIKIDVEGADLLVLKGGERFIQRHRPAILVEYHAPNTAQFDYKPTAIRELLKKWGYTCRKKGKQDLWATP